MVCNRSRRPRRRPSGGAFRVVRIGRFSRCRQRHFRRYRLAHNDSPRLAQQSRHGGIFKRAAAFIQRRAALGGHIVGIDNILDADGKAVQRTHWLAGLFSLIQRPGLFERQIVVHIGPGANHIFALGNSRQARPRQILGREIFRFKPGPGFNSAERPQLVFRLRNWLAPSIPLLYTIVYYKNNLAITFKMAAILWSAGKERNTFRTRMAKTTAKSPGYDPKKQDCHQAQSQGQPTQN